MGIDWNLTTTEDLRATFGNYPKSADAEPAYREYVQRCGEDYFTQTFERRRPDLSPERR